MSFSLDQVCWACNEPMVFSDEHHTRPQAAGGVDKDIVNICTKCHDCCHRLADMLRNPAKAGMVGDAVQREYPNNKKVQQKVLDLAVTVVEWMTAKAEGHVEPLSEVAITITVPLQVKTALALMASETRHTNGRVMGLSTYLRARLCQLAFSKFPSLRPQAP